MAMPPPNRAVAVVEPVVLDLPVERAVVSFSGGASPAILESSRYATDYGRFSILACDPVEEFTFTASQPGCAIRSLARRSAKYPALAEPPADVPFSGGWIGYLSYEAGARVEPTAGAGRDPELPLARFFLYDSAAVFDHSRSRWYATAVDWPAPWSGRRPRVAARLAAVRERLAASADTLPASGPADRGPVTTMAGGMSRRAYFSKVATAKRYIEAGDVYQVNLTQRFDALTDLSPLALYLRLRHADPSSHAALLAWTEAAVVSSSPELFLDLRGRRVITRPIKGTRPRVGSTDLDAWNRAQLEMSEKDRAELNMIVDLHRNDLGRVCTPGSVRVVEPGEIEAHPTVFHRVATISGTLGAGRDWSDLLLASFPSGSVTGAPKIRAMQIIDELEPTPRGVYCGSIGWIGLDGSMSMNVAIRTMVQRGRRVYAYAGGAIVADSDADEEHKEMLAKAVGMRRALGSPAPARDSGLSRAAV